MKRYTAMQLGNSPKRVLCMILIKEHLQCSTQVLLNLVINNVLETDLSTFLKI